MLNTLQSYFNNQSRSRNFKIGLQTNLTVMEDFTGGIEQSYAEFAHEFRNKFNANVTTFTGPNNMHFTAPQVVTNAYAGETIFFPNHSEILKGIELAFTLNSIDVALWADIWGYNNETPKGLQLFKKLVKIIESYPIVWSIMSNHMLRPPNFPWANNPQLFSRFLRGVRAFIAVSKEIQGELLSVGVEKEKIHLIPPPIDTSLFSPVKTNLEKIAIRKELGLPEKDFIILYSGRYSTGKGTNWLMDIWPQIVKANVTPNIHLAMVGETYASYSKTDEWLKRRRAFISNNKYSVTLSDGFVLDQRILAKWYKASDLFVFPSILPEGLPVSLLKAVSTGLPSIATKYSYVNTGVQEVIREGVNGALYNDYESETELRNCNVKCTSFLETLIKVVNSYPSFAVRSRLFSNSTLKEADMSSVAAKHFSVLKASL